MGKRSLSGPAYARRVFTFLHNIVGHYFPIRFTLLYPLYFFLTVHEATDWILDFSRKHATFTQRALAIGGLYVSLPFLWSGWLVSSWYQRLRRGKLAHHPTLAPASTAVPGGLAAAPHVATVEPIAVRASRVSVR
jgi:hypothetical protein